MCQFVVYFFEQTGQLFRQTGGRASRPMCAGARDRRGKVSAQITPNVQKVAFLTKIVIIFPIIVIILTISDKSALYRVTIHIRKIRIFQ